MESETERPNGPVQGQDLSWRLAPDVELQEEEGRLRFDAGARGHLALTPSTPGVADGLRALVNGLSESGRAAMEMSDGFDAALFEYYCLRLQGRRMLEQVLHGPAGDLLVFVPHRSGATLATAGLPGDGLVLSRFAYLHRTDRGMVLASPEASFHAVIAAPEALGWIHSPDGAPVLAAGLLERAGFFERSGEEESEARRSWEFHDRLFHGASRPGMVLWQYGGGFRFQDRFPSPPAVKARFAGERVDLDKPERSALAGESGSLFDVMERRRSHRVMGDPPIRVGQLGELLYRVARTVKVVDSEPQETIVRVVPSGGAIHETEFYLSVRQCQGLEPGFYHYQGLDHVLYRLPNAGPQAAAIVARAGEDWGKPDHPPQVVITLASRLPRLAWKYDTAAYRVSLVNTGVIVQATYLVATDMDLACVPAGRGDPQLFAAATGLDAFEETSMIEIGLGTRDPDAETSVDQIVQLFPTVQGP